MAHVCGCDELPLFDIHRAPCFGSGDQQVSLAAKEGGNLQHCFHVAQGVAGFAALLCRMYVGEDWQDIVFRDCAKDAAAFLHARAAKAMDAGAVCLVVARFEDVGNFQVGGDALDRIGESAGVRLRLEDARARDQKELRTADGRAANLEVCRVSHKVHWSMKWLNVNSQPSPTARETGARRRCTARRSPAPANRPLCYRVFPEWLCASSQSLRRHRANAFRRAKTR